jgi:predicted RNase H-like nuclease
MKIHTDTNIWFEINLDNIKIEQLKKSGVSPNYINVFEITKKNPNETLANIIKAHQNLSSFINEIIDVHPILSCFDVESDTIKGTKQNKEWVEEFKERCNKIGILNGYDYSEDEQQENIEYYSSYSDTYKNTVSNWNEIFNKLKIYQTELCEKDIYYVFNTGIMAQIGVELPQKEFYERELFLKVFLDFANEIIKNTTYEYGKRTKMKTNDMLDLLVLLYVKKGDKYWTTEPEWKKRITKLGFANKYLFDGKEFL